MPCRDPRDDVTTIIKYDKGHDPRYQHEAERLSERCAMLTDLLCKAGRARYTKTSIPAEVIAWWEEHMEIDRSRGEPW